MCEIQNSEIKVHINPEWEQYFDGALDDLIHAANTALARSLESKAARKGKSKGMATSKGKGKNKNSIRNAGKGHKGKNGGTQKSR